MDPDATYERWKRAVRSGDDQEAADAHEDLSDWLRRGGFQPHWTQKQREDFYNWEEQPTEDDDSYDGENPTAGSSSVGTIVVGAGAGLTLCAILLAVLAQVKSTQTTGTS